MEKTHKDSSKKRTFKKFDTSKKFGVKEKATVTETKQIKHLRQRYKRIDPAAIQKLTDFPLSQKTQKGLERGKFTTPTKIQQQSIGLALQGHDILGAAKTGSGKTLAFLIPVLECLYRQKWTSHDGLGALIISPTRELAYQIFEVLQNIGKFHDFSAGLVIGGKHIREEAERINTTNIVICTPGRLLQHMDETAYFNSDNLSVLVLDEADRILDLGFQKTMNAIIDNLPKKRQTLLFSATQTKSVRDLARLSLKEPMYVSVHENAQHSTPTQLQQSYIICNAEDKFNLVWSFVKHHLKAKILVFLASCKQVRFVYEVFRRMRPGVPVMSLHGAMQQMKRMAVYTSFCRKQNAVLFATDIAARGLDFPAINWVIQLDCPEDANTYIHRAGRTARYETNGEALLILLPTEEEPMVSQLQAKKIPIEKIKINPKRQRSIQGKIESLLAADVQLKEFAQRAFVSYLKSVFFMSNKAVFDVTILDLDTLARSFGLAVTPRVRFIERQNKIRTDRAKKNTEKPVTSKEKDSPGTASTETATGQTKKTANLESDDGSDEEESSEASSSNESSSDEESSSSSSASEKPSAKAENKDVISFSGFNDADDDDDDDDILKIKKKNVYCPEDTDEENANETDPASLKKKSKSTSKVAVAKKVLKKHIQLNTKVVFTEEGEEAVDVHRTQQMTFDDESEPEGGIDIDQAKLRLKEEDIFDKHLYHEKIRRRHREERLKEREKRRKKKAGDDDDEEETHVYLGNPGDEEVPDPDLEQDLESYGVGLGGKSGSGDDDGGWDSADYSSDGQSSPKAKRKKLNTREPSDDEDDSDVSVESDDGDAEEQRDSDNGAIDTGLTLADDESLALKLLSGT